MFRFEGAIRQAFCNKNGRRKPVIGEKKDVQLGGPTYDDDLCFHKHSIRSLQAY